jgi:hypothetical protein
VRNAYWHELDGVSQANEIKPPVYDRAGNHILFPVEYTDTTTGYVYAYPDYEKKPHLQIEFFRRVLGRFRASLPKNTTTLSVTGRMITEKLLVEMILDGPWMTCKLHWASLKKEGKVDCMCQELRRNKRKQRVSAIKTVRLELTMTLV